MADRSRIEWTTATWNPIVGCSLVSPGCTHCYAMKQAARIEAMYVGANLKGGGGAPFPPSPYAGVTRDSMAGPVWTGKIGVVDDSAFTKPLRWKRPRSIFVNSMGDPFHEAVPDAAIDRVFAVMALCPQHTFQVLTKRSPRMRRYISGLAAERIAAVAHGLFDERNPHSRSERLVPMFFNRTHDWWRIAIEDVRRASLPLANVYLGVSAEDQRRADERREDLFALAERGWTTFVSYEPALGPVNWTPWGFIDWLISGGESGPNARPSHPDWHRAARDFCAARAIAYFFKQWGAWAPCAPDAAQSEHCGWTPLRGKLGGMAKPEELYPAAGAAYVHRVGKRCAGRLLDGVEHNAFPAAHPGRN